MANFDREDMRRTELNNPVNRARGNTPILIGAGAR